ncbi:RsmE family RNA methyltransferase [Haploplasma axanthum]|nr:RsmE family RNA methyltransferase [Haploplasma axanthum]
MQRYILDDTTNNFYKTDIHHIKKVMRMQTGDKVIVCLHEKCSLVKLNIDENITFDVIENYDENKTLDITLVQGLLKGTKIETTIKYSTIFGAKKIVLVPFERSIAKNKNTDNKTDRYFLIAKEAAELAHREKIPTIEFQDSLKTINWKEYDYVILADEEEKKTLLKDLELKNIFDKKIAIIIGPEGGISDNERKYCKNNKFFSISLGKYIFPAEIAAISILNNFNS